MIQNLTRIKAELVCSAGVMLMTPNAKTVLAVTRTGMEGVLCLPGGVVDQGESATQTMLREFREETGLSLSADLYSPYMKTPFQDVCGSSIIDELPSFCTTFYATAEEDGLRWILENINGRARAEHGGYVRTYLVPMEELLSRTPYRTYTERSLAVYNKLYRPREIHS